MVLQFENDESVKYIFVHGRMGNRVNARPILGDDGVRVYARIVIKSAIEKLAMP